MDAYTGFAELYDMFMDNIPYEQWCAYLIGLLKEHGVTDGLVLELGCGTGTATRLLSEAGYDMIGIDCSGEMLLKAREKEGEEGSGILYLQQDMREFELYGTVKAVVSICDSMNYMASEEDLFQVFSLVNNYLDPGGLFVFDLNTIYKYETLIGDAVIAENREEGSFIWENYYDVEEQINEYELTIFQRINGDHYKKWSETHWQKGYGLPVVQKLLEQAGMEYITAYDAFTKQPPKEDSERLYVLARESGKRKTGGKQEEQ